MGDSQRSSAYSRFGGMQSSADVNSIMTVNGAVLRNSGVLSPLAWQAARPTSSTSLNMLGLNRREALSTSSSAPWSMSPNAGHRPRQRRTLENGGAPASTPSSSAGSPANEAAATAALPFSVGTASMAAPAERAALAARLSGFHDFAMRLPGFSTEGHAALFARRSHGGESDAVRYRCHSPEPLLTPPPSQQQKQQQQQQPANPQSAVAPGPATAEAEKLRQAVHCLAKSSDASVTCEASDASTMSIVSEEARRPSTNADSPERNRKGTEDEVEHRPTTPPAETPQLNGTPRCRNQTPDTELPPGVTAAFRQYLEETRHIILYSGSSEVDRAVALDGLLIRCRELFEVLRDMYALMHVQGTAAERKRFSMVKVLPYDEVTTSSPMSEDSYRVSSSTTTSASSASGAQHSTALRIRDGASETKGAPLSSMTLPRNSQLPPLGWRPLTSAAATRSKDAFERVRRTSVSSCSSSVACIEVLNNYYVTRLVGVGATGRVYLAVDRQTCKKFAIKTVPRHSRKSLGRRFPLASMSASDSEPLQMNGSPLGDAPIESAAAHAACGTASNAPPALVRPFSATTTSALPARRREGPRDSMNVSLNEAALESLIQVATLSQPSDTAIPFVESVTASLSAMAPGSGGGDAPNTAKTQPPRTASCKSLDGYVSPTHVGDSRLHSTMRRSTIVAEGVGGGSANKSVKSAPSNELLPVEREIRVMRRVCNHPHVVQLKEVIDDEEEDSVHLVMTYAENGPLTVMHGFDTVLGWAPCDVVRPFSRCVRLLHQLAEALIYLHRQRIVHNDVKPDNILITEADSILLTDFGESVLIPKRLPQLPASRMSSGCAGGEGLNASVLVPHNRWRSSRGANDSWATLSMIDRSPWGSSPGLHNANASQMMAETSFLPDSSMFLAVGVDVEGRLKENRSAIGTPAFAAPELIMNSTCSYDSDAWSFGVVLYAVVFGRLPFAAATVSGTFDHILHSTLSFPSWKEVPQPGGMTEVAYHECVELCTKLLVREPQQRMPLLAVLRHPLFRSSSTLDAKSFMPSSDAIEMPRGRRSPSGLHSDLPSSPAPWRSNRSNHMSRPMSGRDASPLMSRMTRATVPSAMSREVSAAASAATNRRCIAKESASPSFLTGGVARETTLDRHQVQRMASNGRAFATFASSGTSTVSLSPPGTSAGFGRRSKPTFLVDVAPEMWPEVSTVSPSPLQCQYSSQPSSPEGQRSLSGTSSVHTASFTATEQRGRLREHTLVYSQGFVSESSSTLEVQINQSLFAASCLQKESPPDCVRAPGMQLTCCAGFTSPLQCPLTRAGSSTPVLSAEVNEKNQQGKSAKEELRSPRGAGAATAVAVVAAPAPPTSPPATSSLVRPRSVAEAREIGEGAVVGIPHAQCRRSEEEPCEEEGGTFAAFNYFSYWESSLSDVADSGDSAHEGPPQPPRGHSSGPAGGARPLVSAQELIAQHGKQKNKRERVKFVPAFTDEDPAIAPGASGSCFAGVEQLPEAGEAGPLAQRRVPRPSPTSEDLRRNGSSRGRSSSPRQSFHQSTSVVPPAQGRKSRLWRQR
ncbi:hypothetical protein LSCM1_04324 [Leishmania martiniquensis]|uniref:Protein kinase domain-containing protein n=1 Tax=Leishmania martiniquensis TaxID=1580590 RepID=A0A836G2A9_9TRYP|nr:hypothetical protein LSCM1_04324 [Leishmania martiniquensis]